MPTLLRVYTNEDDALLFWSVTAAIPGCRGFAIERKITRAGTHVEQRGFLMNRIGFTGDSAEPTEEGKAVQKPSTEWPFQRLSWTDHDANTGDTVSYRIVPMIRKGAAGLDALEHEASDFSTPRTLGATTASAKFRAFFNRGFVMSQFMARYLSERKLSLKQFKQQIGTTAGREAEHTIRNFLAGALRTELLRLLDDARANGEDVYAALFEVSDQELLTALAALGPHAHVVLANGSVQKAKGETSEEARAGDENAAARRTLLGVGVDVGKHDRFIAPGALGHNKFMVVTRARKPAIVWTGSTNWAPTGLCTQVNNGLLIDDAGVASIYRDQWDRLRAAASGFPDALVTSNSSPHQAGTSTVWFSRTRKSVDLAALNAEVAAAKQGILFLMFMPGATGVLGNVARRAQEPGLYVRGVVSELPNGLNDDSTADVHLVDGAKTTQLHLDIIQPEGVDLSMSRFAEEVTRKQFLSQVGHAIIHSKVLVIDPFSDHPVVITGSHNFSGAASTKNDENFIVIRGDRALAEAYAVNIEGAYQHYRWRAFLHETEKPFEGLKDSDDWLARKLAGARRELAFWGVEPAPHG